MDYLELAKDYFFELKEEVLDEDRHSLGVEEEREFEQDGQKFTILVSGYWGKSDWFNYTVFDSDRNIIMEDTYYS